MSFFLMQGCQNCSFISWNCEFTSHSSEFYISHFYNFNLIFPPRNFRHLNWPHEHAEFWLKKSELQVYNSIVRSRSVVVVICLKSCLNFGSFSCFKDSELWIGTYCRHVFRRIMDDVICGCGVTGCSLYS